MAERKSTKTASKKVVQFLGTGRRKKAIARVRLIPNGTGKITVNKVDIDKYMASTYSCPNTLTMAASEYFAVKSAYACLPGFRCLL